MRDNLLAVGPHPVIRQKVAKRPKNFSGANVVPRQPPATPELASSARNGSGLSNGGTVKLCDWFGRTRAKTKAKKTPEEIAEENERTNEVSLFNRADAYLLCAKRLIENPPAHLRFDAPIDFLLFHAAELCRHLH